MTKEELKKNFPDFKDKIVELSFSSSDDESDKAAVS